MYSVSKLLSKYLVGGWLACMGSCPWGKRAEKVKIKCPRERCTCLGQVKGFLFLSPLQHKHSVARTLLDRAKNIPSTDKDKKSEVQHVVDTLKTNGYTDQFLKSCQRTKPPKALIQPQNNKPQSHRGFVTLPYFQGISEKIARTLGQFEVNVAHKPVKTVGLILMRKRAIELPNNW